MSRRVSDNVKDSMADCCETLACRAKLQCELISRHFSEIMLKRGWQTFTFTR